MDPAAGRMGDPPTAAGPVRTARNLSRAPLPRPSRYGPPPGARGPGRPAEPASPRLRVFLRRPLPAGEGQGEGRRVPTAPPRAGRWRQDLRPQHAPRRRPVRELTCPARTRARPRLGRQSQHRYPTASGVENGEVYSLWRVEREADRRGARGWIRLDAQRGARGLWRGLTATRPRSSPGPRPSR